MSYQPSRKRGEFPGRQKALYIRGKYLFLWGRFEARADEAGLSHSEAAAEAIELWLAVHGEPEKTPLFTAVR